MKTTEAVTLPKHPKNRTVFGREATCKKCGKEEILRERFGLSWDT